MYYSIIIYSFLECHDNLLIKNESGELCNNKSDCFCVGHFCIVGGSCRSGNAFVRGKPICEDDWGNIEANVFCRTIGYERATHSTIDST